MNGAMVSCFAVHFFRKKHFFALFGSQLFLLFEFECESTSMRSGHIARVVAHIHKQVR